MVLSKTAGDADENLRCTFASRYACSSLPRLKIPEGSMPKEAAYQIVKDELMLDGNPRLNLASFVTTWMEPECDQLIMASINKNYVDMDEYPVTTELQVSFLHSPLHPLLSTHFIYLLINCSMQNRCVNIIAHLFHAPVGDDGTALGVGTVGSSEAIMLAGLAFKRKWQDKMKLKGKPFTNPNIVTGANVQVFSFVP